MTTKTVVGMVGLRTSGNPLKQPDGALLRADNCIIQTRDCIEPRRGQQYDLEMDALTGDTGHNRIRELFQWQTHLLASMKGDAIGGDSGWRLCAISNYGASNAAQLGKYTARDVGVTSGEYTPPDPTIERMKFAALAKSVHFTTDKGLCSLDAIAGIPRSSGVVAPGDFAFIDTAGSGTRMIGNPNDTGSWMPKDSAVAGRATLCRLDANGTIIVSRPCGRAVIINPADLVIAIGGVVRAANVVTVTLAALQMHNLQIGDSINLTLTGADIGNFATTNRIVTAVTATTFTYADVAANYTNVAAVTFTSGTKYLQWVVVLPGGTSGFPGVDSKTFVRIYRTDPSASAATDPGDECALIYERFLTATDITNGYVVVTDYVPPTFAGEALPTNTATGDGPLAGSNDRPPICRDICTWNGRLWGLQTTDTQRLGLRLIGTGTPAGLQANDIIFINDQYVTAGTHFILTTAFLPSRNIQRTLQSFVYYTNLNGPAGVGGGALFGNAGLDDVTIAVRAVYDPSLPTGQLIFEKTSKPAQAFYLATTRPSAFQDRIPLALVVTAANTSRTSNVVTVRCAGHGFKVGDTIVFTDNSDANFPSGLKTVTVVTDANNFKYAEAGSNATLSGAVPHYVYAATYGSNNNPQMLRHSKTLEPQSWPQVFAIGGLPDGAEGLRIKPSASGDRLFVFLKNGDIYTLSGAYPYSVNKFNGSAELVAADSLAEHAGKLHALTTQGVVSISDSGVQLHSTNIQEELRLAMFDVVSNAVALEGIFGVSYESERQYQLWLPDPSQGAGHLGYVLNSLVGEWTRWLADRACGLVFRSADVGDILLMGDLVSNRIRLERKRAGDTRYLNFCDEQQALAGAAAGAVFTSTSGPAWVPNAGDALEAPVASGVYYRVVSAESSGGGYKITVDKPIVSAPVTATIFRAYAVTLVTTPKSMVAPGIESIWRDLQLLFSDRAMTSLEAVLISDLKNEGLIIITDAAHVVGQFSSQYGVGVAPTKDRIVVPRDESRAATLSVGFVLNEALSSFSFLGFSLTAEESSEKSGR